MTIIYEPALYKLVMRSNKPIAQKFQEWICEEVLPSCICIKNKRI